MQDRIEDNRRKAAAEDRDRVYETYAERERQLNKYREVIERQERELDAYRARLKEEQIAREQELQQQIEARERLFAEREKKLVERQRDFERSLMHRQAENEALREHLQKEVANREAQLAQAMIDLAQEKERYNEESRRKLEKTSKDYVADALETLKSKEREFHRIAKSWSLAGAVSILGAIAFFAYLTLAPGFSLPQTITWEFLVFVLFKGLVAVALIAAFSRYAFLFSTSYMQEALKNADRRHAINFGKFYLESYGAAADWAQVKEAFEHWNISGSNAFTRGPGELPTLSTLEHASALVEKLGKALPKAKTEGGA